MLKPIVLLTVYRRYYDLQRAIKLIHEYETSFTIKPDIVVVWAQPEPALQWFMDELKVNTLLSREKLVYEGERCGTTYPESHNIRLGLNYIKRTYGENCYVIVQAADIEVRSDTYGEIDREMQKGTNLCVFHWSNGCVPVGCFHTNFFAVSMNEEYWTPVANYDEYDVLEWMWGKRLLGYTSDYNFKYTKLNRELFKHEHRPPIFPPAKGCAFLNTLGYDNKQIQLPLFMSGYLPWYKKFWKHILNFIWSED